MTVHELPSQCSTSGRPGGTADEETDPVAQMSLAEDAAMPPST